MKKRGVYINQPDNYFFQGGNKEGMGYNENQYSLPRWEDISVSRQTVYDDTFKFIPTQGWMFVPLVDYHGGGDAAAFEPMSQHLVEYEWALAQYLGMGVAACYRGFRLYDTDEVKSVVTKWVNFYKTYREIIISDVIHVRRPDMLGIDCMLHVNPQLEICGMAMVFNPTSIYVNETLLLPLYYTGITEVALVQEQNNTVSSFKLDRNFNIELTIILPPMSITWFAVQNGDGKF